MVMKDRFCVALMAGVIALPLFTAGVLAADAPPPPPPAHTGEQQGKTDGAKKTAESGESDAKKAGKDVKNGATKAGKDVKHGLEKFGQDVSDFFHGVFD
jgi:type IV secretory pathway TrbL component